MVPALTSLSHLERGPAPFDPREVLLRGEVPFVDVPPQPAEETFCNDTLHVQQVVEPATSCGTMR